jgi:hypothetical protein
MDLQSFVSLKNSSELDILSNEFQNIINILNNGKKNYKYNETTSYKSNKNVINKDKLENKINIILNKLSEINFNNLLIEFIETIGKISEQDYENLQKIFYLKMLLDISFIKNYMEFFKIITNVYRLEYNLLPKFFIKIIEGKFMHDYNNIEYADDLMFLKEFDNEDKTNITAELKRINNLTIIKSLINGNLLNQECANSINNIILEQNNFNIDIYYWFQNVIFDDNLGNKIKHKINNTALQYREKVLLDTLFNEHKIEETDIVVEKQIITNTLDIEIENIIDEYLYIETLDEIKFFITNRCKDAISKNKFCQILFTKYFDILENDSEKILELIKILIKKQILFKSNLSRGLLLLYNKTKNMDSKLEKSKMKNLLICLKNMSITKNIEYIYSNYNIECNTV